jgi:dipeptidyl aminopeptidase/acylaminoacyl peptidase
MVMAMRGMVPEDLYELRWVADPRLSPDGATVAFVESWLDRESNASAGRICMVPSDGSDEAWRFTSGPKRDANPRWSPDGRRLAFLSNRDSETMQLYVIDVAGGEAQRLTDLKESINEIEWSPDGSRIAFTARVRLEDEESDERKRKPRRFKRLLFKLDDVGWVDDRRTHVYTIAADGSSDPVLATDGDFEDGNFAWSPDGSRIAFVSARDDRWDTDTTRDLYVVDASGGVPELITFGDGVCDAPSWSPDGTRIAFRYSPERVDDYPRHCQIAVLDLGSRTRQILTASLDRNCAPYPDLREPIWRDGTVLFTIEDHGNTHLYEVAADGSTDPKPIIAGDLAVAGYDAVGDALVHLETNPVLPPELYSGDTRLTELTRPFCEGRELVAPEPFTATSPDGSVVDAWIVPPAGKVEGRRYPVLLNIHGGPYTQYGNRFFDEFQVYAGAGYAVVYSNPRGSSGSTESWSRAIRGPGKEGPGFGSVDYEDLMAVMDTALERYPFCDPERLGVMGGSYGGFMTSWIVAHTDRFKAGCSERAVNNWMSFFGSSDVGWGFGSYVGSYPFENPDAYLRVSPSQFAARISTPLLLVHSDDDLRAPVEQAEHLFTILRLLGKEVEFVRFPAESHELSRSGSPAHRFMRFEVILEWFAGYLQVDG